MTLHPLDIPRPKDRYETDLYDQTASRDNLLGLLLFLFGVILVPAVAAGVVWVWGR